MATNTYNLNTYKAIFLAKEPTLTIGGSTGKTFNGTVNVSFSKDEILGSSDSTKFLRGDKAWSNILTRADHTADIGFIVENTDTTNPLKIGYIIGGSGNAGIYDYTHTAWKVQIAPSGTTTFIGSLDGNATTASYPLGFSSRSASSGWGDLTGSWITAWNTSSAGSIAFMNDNPSSGKLSVKVDGRFYIAEGLVPVAGLKTDGTYWGMTSPDGEDNVWIRTTTQGIIPYQTGGIGSGHNNLGTSAWYFAAAYVDNVNSHVLNLRGATTATMTSATTNPRITFSESSNDTQPVILTYTDADAYRAPAGLKIVGGTNASPAWLEVEGQIYTAGGTMTGALTFTNDAGIYYQGTKANYRMIRFIDNTADEYGNGISIGGGGLTVLGSGESANTILSNLSLTSSGGTETTYIGSDGSIEFYPSINSWDAAARIQMTAGTLWAGVDGDTTRENRIGVQSGSGQIYMYAQASATGGRGIYVPAHGTGGARAVFSIGTNNEVYFADGYNGTATRLAYSQAGLAGSAISWLTCWNGYELRAINAANTRQFLFGSSSIGNVNTPIYYDGTNLAQGNNKLGAAYANSYWGMRAADNTDAWIRTTTSGIIPVQSGGAGSGHSSLGTSTWYFSAAYIDNVYGTLNGDASRAKFGDSNNGTHDSNSMTTNGFYYYNSNGPAAASQGSETADGAMFVQAYSTNWVGQVAQDYRTGQLWARGKNNGTWASWKKVVMADETSTALTNCDSVKHTGIWTNGAFTNRPSKVSNWGSLFNIRLYKDNNNYHRQLFFDCYGTNRIWTRSDNAGTWTVWREVLTNATTFTVKTNVTFTNGYGTYRDDRIAGNSKIIVGGNNSGSTGVVFSVETFTGGVGIHACKVYNGAGGTLSWSGTLNNIYIFVDNSDV